MTLSCFLPLSIVLLFRFDVDDSVHSRIVACLSLSFFLFYYLFSNEFVGIFFFFFDYILFDLLFLLVG